LACARAAKRRSRTRASPWEWFARRLNSRGITVLVGMGFIAAFPAVGQRCFWRWRLAWSRDRPCRSPFSLLSPDYRKDEPEREVILTGTSRSRRLSRRPLGWDALQAPVLGLAPRSLFGRYPHRSSIDSRGARVRPSTYHNVLVIRRFLGLAATSAAGFSPPFSSASGLGWRPGRASSASPSRHTHVFLRHGDGIAGGGHRGVLFRLGQAWRASRLHPGCPR
jgi:hypothetical protein